MKVTELRIGNHIHISSLTDGTEIDVECSLFHLQEMNTTVKYHYKPIPLTEEWLLKFGFKTNDVRFWKLKGWRIYVNRYGEYIYKGETEDTEIKHVHQLQNLYFALTGEELQITNDTKIQG